MSKNTPQKQSLTHQELCQLAVGWLKRPASRGGHGCQLAIAECRSGHTGEVPDAIGWRYTDDANDGSVLVECKTSRADFLADMAKPHRQAGGLGNWRYYLAPEGLIKPEELPPMWGLVEANHRRQLRLVVGPYTETNYYKRQERLQAYKQDSELTKELFIVVRLFSRIDNANESNASYREILRRANTAADLSEQVRKLQLQLYLQHHQLDRLNTVQIQPY